MIKDWNIDEIKHIIDAIARAEDDKYLDGFITWGCKRDLYEILWHVQERLENCSTYAGEDEFVKKHDIGKMWSILKK